MTYWTQAITQPQTHMHALSHSHTVALTLRSLPWSLFLRTVLHEVQLGDNFFSTHLMAPWASDPPHTHTEVHPRVYTLFHFASPVCLMSCLIWFHFLFYVLHSTNNVNAVTCTFTGLTEFVIAADQHALTYSLDLQGCGYTDYIHRLLKWVLT